VLKQLRAEALIELKERAVVVRDWERLQKIGEFRPDYLFLPPKAGNQGSHQPIA
jgi:hypothetical protein